MPERPKRRKNNKNKRKNKNKPESVQLKSDACSSNSQDNVPCEASVNNKVDDNLSQKILDSSCLNVSSNTANCESDKTLQNDDKKQQVPLPEQDLNNNNDHVELSSNSNGNISKYKGVEDYVVESPDQSLKAKPKLTDLKSKSLDNDDAPKIIELSEDSNVQSEDDTLAIIDSSNVTVSDVESDVEWEKTDDLNKNTDIPTKDIAHGTLSVTAIPLNIAQCDFTKSLTLDEERSLRQYLSSLNLATNPSNTFEIKEEIEHIINREVRHRLRKKGLAEDIPMLRPGPSRTLDVIDEEGSCDSSTSSRRHSYLNDKKHKNEDLDDNVFEDLKKNTDKYMTSRPTKSKINLGRQIPQECVLVDAKIVEPKMSEVRGEWSVKTVEQLTGAEVVYLTDSSSSTSSLYEVDNETDDGVETDVSVRIITPTIEVTDTENLLKRSFLKDTDETLKNHDKNITADNNDNITPENSHEIVILSTDDIKTDLYVKNIDDIDTDNKTLKQPQKSDTYDVEIKVIKCELNNAINNLISSDCENQIDNTKDTFVRQDSSSSVCSSQCTAKYNPSHSSLNDVSNFVHDEAGDNNNTNPENGPYKTPSNVSHVKDVFDSVTGLKRDWTSFNGKETKKLAKNPWSLKDLCVRRIASFPYGEKILEELASVSKRLQNITVLNANTAVLNETRATATKSTQKKANIKDNYNSNHMPYFPLPDVSYIDQISLPVQQKDTAPPPIQPRHSSLKSHDDRHWSAVPTKQEPLYVCLSPSQKMLMEKTNTFITKEDATQLYESHKKFVDRRGYNEKSKMTEEHNAEAPIVSFKSQTGSRLLALIRDPTVAGNINSSVNSRFNRSVDNIHKNFKNFETMSRNNTDRSTSLRDTSSSFRPIPPPRPKKLSAFYESDESSDFTDSSLRSMKNERKSFHYSTGNLTREIEQDVSSIQNMHRYYTNLRDQNNQASPRRPSLPKDLCDQQMEYIRQKEKEVEAELKRLEYEKTNHIAKKGPRAPLLSEKDIVENLDINNSFSFHKKGYEHIASFTENVNKGKLSVFSSSQEELLRDKMYSEYVNQMAERQERKQHKVIKLSNYPTSSNKAVSKSMSSVDKLESKVNNRIEKEFICKARERWNKLGIRDPETEDETESNKDIYREPKVIEHKIKVIEGDKEKDVQKLPNHLQEFVEFTADKDRMAVWRPGAPTPPPAPVQDRSPGAPPPPPPPPVWTPASAGPSPQAPRKSFTPVHFEDTPPARRKFGSSDHNGCTSGSESEGRLKTSHSAPATGLNTLGGFSSSRLPKVQNPTVTLLQKARDGQLARGSGFPQERDVRGLPRDRPSPPRGDPVHALRREYASESEADRGDSVRRSKMADERRKVEGIGPTTKDGMPVALRSEVKDQSKWYKKMYDTIHKNKYDNDYVTIRYKNPRGEPPTRISNKSQYAYFDPRSGYLSEPEGGISRLGSGYDSDVTSGSRRRTASVQEERGEEITSPYLPNNKYSTLASARASQEVYKNQPGRIENYVPGKSSVVDKETKQQNNMSSTTSLPQASPKDKKDVTSAILSKSNMARALKESGYESDSTLIFRRREETDGPLSPAERRAAYRDLQAGGEPPLRGFRSPAPNRQESPRRYVESDVNIHYRCPVRRDPLPLVPERELARQQAEHMKKLYREQRRNKYLQELQDMQNRRHQDNFTPSQKTVVPLNRYDETDRVVARALYAFNGQTNRELNFRKGDMIQVRRQIDANWYEGEVHGRIGLFPYNYVELLKGDVPHSPKKPAVIEGRARAKFDFTAQTNLELPLKKGEVVVLTRRIDHNWWEGRNGGKTGIFPDSYVTVLQEPSIGKLEQQTILHPVDKPAASPAAHGVLNGSAKRSMGAHSYLPQPNNPALANAPPATQPLPNYPVKPSQGRLTPSERGYGPPAAPGVDLNNTEPLYVDTNAEAVPYRAMYKYRPQNPDELELSEGDTVYVLERCDDGWYVGSSQRSGRFGTFPGNYVERI